MGPSRRYVGPAVDMIGAMHAADQAQRSVVLGDIDSLHCAEILRAARNPQVDKRNSRLAARNGQPHGSLISAITASIRRHAYSK